MSSPSYYYLKENQWYYSHQLVGLGETDNISLMLDLELGVSLTHNESGVLVIDYLSESISEAMMTQITMVAIEGGRK